MNELPCELICLIFNHLNLTDLFQNCRLVCKRWKELVDSIQFQNLTITDFKHSYSIFRHSIESIDLNRSLYFHDDLFNLRSIINKNNFSKLKYFKFYFDNSLTFRGRFEFDLEDFNKLNHLEHLELRPGFFEPEKESTLTFPNLKYFYLCLNMAVLKPILLIRIDAIQLKTLICTNLKNLEVVHPKSIQFLEEEYRIVNEFPNLKMFNNLKEYKLYFEGGLPYNVDLVSKLPNLLENCYLANLYAWTHRETNNDWNNYFNQILNDKILKKRSKLKIYFNGIELKNSNQYFEPYEPDETESDDSNEDESNEDDYDYYGYEFYHRHYEQLTTLSSFIRISYNLLIKKFENVIPENFFSKFNNIKELYIRGPVDQNQFIWFLKGCLNLSALNLDKGHLNQQFYDQLPKIKSFLTCLNHFKGDDENIEIDFQFITKFKFLSEFKTNQQFSIESAEYLIKNTKYLSKFEFKYMDDDLVISRNPRTNNCTCIFMEKLMDVLKI